MPQTMNNRAYSVLEIKAFNDDKRELTGTATTPTPDRAGDIVDPMGAKFAPEIPLLWQHQHDKPVGTVRFDKPTKNGITFKASLPKIEEPGPLKDLVDLAWGAVREKLVRGVSIGFRPIEYSFIDGGGVRFAETEIYELSLVTVPMQAQATIQTIKSIDQAQRAASGTTAQGSQPPAKANPPPGASGTKHKPATSRFFYARNSEGNEMKSTIAEQIQALEATRAAKAARLSEVMTKSQEEGRSTDAAEAEEFDATEAELASVDADLVRLKKLEKLNIEKATTVTASGNGSGTVTRLPVTVKTVEKLEPGILAARYIMCLGVAKGNLAVAAQLAERHYPHSESVVKTLKFQAEGADLSQMFMQKATVPAGTTTDSTWAAPLVVAQNWGGDFVEYLRPRTLIGQAQFRPVPFNVAIGGQTSGGTAKWTGEGKSKSATKFDFIRYTTAYTKVAAISVVTKELLRLSDPSAEALVRDGLADAVIERIDSDLFDPDIAAVAGVNPAGLLNGVTPVAGPSGTDPDDFQAAIDRLWAPWDSTMMGARPAYYTTPAAARRLAGLRDALGNRAYPNMSNTGGNIDGIPVRVSQYLANNGGSGGAPFILVDESEIWLADDGSVTLDFSDHATIEMTDVPVGSSSATVTSNGSPFVNMFQTNSRAFLAERAIWFAKRRNGAVQWIDGMPTS